MEKKKTPAKIFWITKDAGINRILWYLILTVLLSAFCFITLHVWLSPYSLAFNETGVMTPGYFLYAAIGILFSTSGPFVAVWFGVAIAIWVWGERKEKRIIAEG